MNTGWLTLFGWFFRFSFMVCLSSEILYKLHLHPELEQSWEKLLLIDILGREFWNDDYDGFAKLRCCFCDAC